MMLSKRQLLKFKGSAQDGMSLVGVLISVGLLGIFAFLTMISVSNNMFVRKVTRVQRSYENLDQALVYEIKDRMLGNVIENQCQLNKAINVANQLSGLELVDGIELSISTAVWSGTADNSVKDAVQRCTRPRIALPAKAGDDYYFCMKFNLNGSKEHVGELKSVDQAFVEVKVELIDFNQNSISGPSLGCNDYRNSSSTGIRVTYMTYLRYNSGTNSIVKEMGGFHLFPKEI